MANFRILLDIDNDAFAGDNRTGEIARILCAAAKGIRFGADLDAGLPLRDEKGNVVGRAQIIR